MKLRPRGTRLTAHLAGVPWRVTPCAQALRADPMRPGRPSVIIDDGKMSTALRRAPGNMARTSFLRNLDAIRKESPDAGLADVRHLEPGEPQ